MAWDQEAVNKVTTQVLEKAATDAEFRAKCFSDAKGVVEEVSGQSLPDDITIRFVDNEKASYTVVLPDLVQENAELSDSDLENVAGGRCGGTCAGGTQASASLGFCF